MKSNSKSKRLDLPLLMISSTASSYVRVIFFYIHTVWAYISIYSNCSNRRHHRYRSHHWSDTFPRRYEWNVSTSVRMRQLYSHWWLYRHLIFNVPLSKLYTNSLMSSLNARGGWKLSSQSRDANSTAGVHTTKSMVKLSQSGGRNARPEVDIFLLHCIPRPSLIFDLFNRCSSTSSHTKWSTKRIPTKCSRNPNRKQISIHAIKKSTQQSPPSKVYVYDSILLSSIFLLPCIRTNSWHLNVIQKWVATYKRIESVLPCVIHAWARCSLLWSDWHAMGKSIAWSTSEVHLGSSNDLGSQTYARGLVICLWGELVMEE